jgi:hypothetical protein
MLVSTAGDGPLTAERTRVERSERWQAESDMTANVYLHSAPESLCWCARKILQTTWENVNAGIAPACDDQCHSRKPLSKKRKDQ